MLLVATVVDGGLAFAVSSGIRMVVSTVQHLETLIMASP